MKTDCGSWFAYVFMRTQHSIRINLKTYEKCAFVVWQTTNNWKYNLNNKNATFHVAAQIIYAILVLCFHSLSLFFLLCLLNLPSFVRLSSLSTRMLNEILAVTVYCNVSDSISFNLSFSTESAYIEFKCVEWLSFYCPILAVDVTTFSME